MKRSLIRSTGRYIPPRLVTNEDLTRFMDTTDEWIQQRTGIEQRYWIPEEGGVGASDLALEASRIALDRAGWKAEDIDLIIFATLSPDIFFPGSGCLLQDKLGLETTPALDIRQQCTGFIYGLATADAYIKAGMVNRVLVVGAEVHSSGLDISTRGRDVAVLFGDGAGVACVEGVETEKEIGILATALHAQGRHASSLMLEAPASRYTERITAEMLEQGRHYPTMEGKTVFKHAVRRLPEVTHEVLEKAALGLDDIDLIIPHQANLRINQFYQRALGVADEKMFHNIMRYGNTTAGSIPIAMDEAIELGRLDTKKDTLLLTALGAGLTWAGLVYRFGSED
ncbi:3-oxoacyl-[acyl-carrier-protein] synthase III [Desulfobotulus alkaliphilus]|uniref:Beta-ketoacyl-[acyl-carrier-protein] synthase III n=1 Tax=Desulfobotulus alkaliphilus TaxID=622671 RepID=A0A562RYZ6_9BACT|nr:beta-ketoacyl-ACP synthase III [Desulfobotulus alkaliphilus]TWI74332.1 3-oxoacyl-[acyl-carrier-protein] synthase III [Desulfobotulus alkaliphilus]